jgi:hypothetical protein
MSQTIEQTDAAIRNTFHNMEEGVDYVLNDFWFTETNRLRKEYNYPLLKNKREYKFSRKGDQLVVNNKLVFDFDGKHNLTFALAFALTLALDGRRPRSTLALTLAVAVAFSLQHNGLEKLNKDTCDGKVVEIDGKKYKLTAV